MPPFADPSLSPPLPVKVTSFSSLVDDPFHSQLRVRGRAVPSWVVSPRRGGLPKRGYPFFRGRLISRSTSRKSAFRLVPPPSVIPSLRRRMQWTFLPLDDLIYRFLRDEVVEVFPKQATEMIFRQSSRPPSPSASSPQNSPLDRRKRAPASRIVGAFGLLETAARSSLGFSFSYKRCLFSFGGSRQENDF